MGAKEVLQKEDLLEDGGFEDDGEIDELFADLGATSEN